MLDARLYGHSLLTLNTIPSKRTGIFIEKPPSGYYQEPYVFPLRDQTLPFQQPVFTGTSQST